MKFCTSYKYDRKKWGLIIDADSWSDAEHRCKQLNLDLNGEFIFSIPAWSVSDFVVALICNVRNAIYKYKRNQAIQKILTKVFSK